MSINDIVQIQMNEFLKIAEEFAIYTPIIRIEENLQMDEMMGTDTVVLPKILVEEIDLIALNGTITDPTMALNGTEFVTVEDTIFSEINTMSISSWIKPEFNAGTPQYTIVSKENSFNLYVKNIMEPRHTAVFSVFDGIQWNDISGHTTLDERMASHNGISEWHEYWVIRRW